MIHAKRSGTSIMGSCQFPQAFYAA